MVQINKEKREIIITMPGDENHLQEMQNGLIMLVQLFNYKDFAQMADQPIYSALKLLAALLPNYQQIKRAFVSEADYMELPAELTANQRRSIHEAMTEIKNPEIRVRSQPNPLKAVLMTITD
jgi:hypothetical protein